MTTSEKPPICLWCKHFARTNDLVCKAFPNEIPMPIQSGRNDHRSAYIGDGGLRFELAKGLKLPEQYQEEVVPEEEDPQLAAR
jgi:hypothetical protein